MIQWPRLELETWVVAIILGCAGAGLSAFMAQSLSALYHVMTGLALFGGWLVWIFFKNVTVDGEQTVWGAFVGFAVVLAMLVMHTSLT